MDGVCNDADISDNIIPSSNIEPPPPVEYRIPTHQAKQILAAESFESTANNSKGSAGFEGSKTSFNYDNSLLYESHLHTQQDGIASFCLIRHYRFRGHPPIFVKPPFNWYAKFVQHDVIT